MVREYRWIICGLVCKNHIRKCIIAGINIGDCPYRIGRIIIDFVTLHTLYKETQIKILIC